MVGATVVGIDIFLFPFTIFEYLFSFMVWLFLISWIMSANWYSELSDTVSETYEQYKRDRNK